MEIITLAARFIQYQTKNKNSHHGFKNSFPFIKIHFSLAFQRFPTAGYYLKFFRTPYRKMAHIVIYIKNRLRRLINKNRMIRSNESWKFQAGILGPGLI